MLIPTADEITPLILNQPQPTPLRICSGGTTSRCAEDGHWTIDLGRNVRHLSCHANQSTIRFGSGWSMGELQAHLAHQDCMIASGLSGLPGAGFILTGGMGPLSRSLGLAIDHVQSIEGTWGNGHGFALQRATEQIPHTEMIQKQWRALLGAGLFLGVVHTIELRCHPRLSLKVVQGCIDQTELVALIQTAETFPKGLTLQWCWGDAIEIMLVARRDDITALTTLASVQTQLSGVKLHTTDILGLGELPGFGSLANPAAPSATTHQEVVGLLGPRWGEATAQLIAKLQTWMDRRPHPGCTVASQQLGGAVRQHSPEASAFLHRDAEWKPWITASWPMNDGHARQAAIDWLNNVWAQLHVVCPGVHLAQLHDHMPWHAREVHSAFGAWLPELRVLKQQLDPAGLLPPL